MRLFVLTRHAHSTLNLAGRVNGDPSVSAPLTPEGRTQAERLGDELSALPLDLCVHTRFGRTRTTAEIALGDRPVPLEEEQLLDDIYVGELEGRTIAEYRAWKAEHSRKDTFPGGESLDDAARRFAQGFRSLLDGEERAVLVVCHEIPVRYAINSALGSDSLDAPAHGIGNCVPHLFDEDGLSRAVERMRLLS